MSAYIELAYAAAAKRLCLFTGTGFSKALTDNVAPSWQGLLEQICDKNGLADLSSTLFPKAEPKLLNYEEAAQVIAICLAKSDKGIHDEVASLITKLVPTAELPETHKFLRDRPYRIITTNYDKLAEMLAGNDCHVLAPGLPVPRSNARAKVFHVHGSIDAPQRMVVTAEDYFSFMHSDSYFSRKMNTMLHENTVVFLGYSLGDTNLKAILSEYRSFMRDHVVSSNLFLVSRSMVDENVKDYYAASYGIRVIAETEIEEFFEHLNSKIVDVEKKLEGSVDNIRKVLFDGHHFTESYLSSENSFYEIVASIGAIGQSLNHPVVVNLLKDIVSKKKILTTRTGAWNQYVELAAWLNYLGSLLDIKGTSLEATYLDAVQYSLEHSSQGYAHGYSWHAYTVWDLRWNSIRSSNRTLITKHIQAASTDPDAKRIVAKG